MKENNREIFLWQTEIGTLVDRVRNLSQVGNDSVHVGFVRRIVSAKCVHRTGDDLIRIGGRWMSRCLQHLGVRAFLSPVL